MNQNQFQKQFLNLQSKKLQSQSNQLSFKSTTFSVMRLKHIWTGLLRTF
jgi:hypothetical protein